MNGLRLLLRLPHHQRKSPGCLPVFKCFPATQCRDCSRAQSKYAWSYCCSVSMTFLGTLAIEGSDWFLTRQKRLADLHLLLLSSSFILPKASFGEDQISHSHQKMSLPFERLEAESFVCQCARIYYFSLLHRQISSLRLALAWVRCFLKAVGSHWTVHSSFRCLLASLLRSVLPDQLCLPRQTSCSTSFSLGGFWNRRHSCSYLLHS